MVAIAMSHPGEIVPYSDQLKRQIDGAALRKARRLRGMTRDELAREFGASLNTLFRWEHKKSKPLPVYRSKIVDFIEETNHMIRTGKIDQDAIDAYDESLDDID